MFDDNFIDDMDDIEYYKDVVMPPIPKPFPPTWETKVRKLTNEELMKELETVFDD